jgi:hypothetical protein
MSKQCPITHQHCHDPLCEEDLCQIDYQRGKQKYDAPEMGKPKSEEYWDKVMEKLAANPFNQHSPEGRNDYWHVINKQMEIMGDLARALNKPIFIDIDEPEHHHKPKARSLGVTLIAGTLINSFSFNVKNKTMSVSFKKTGGATATLNGFAADGVTDATADIDLTSITAVSNHPEFFTATVDATNPLIVHLAGAGTDGVGTITYNAKTLEGVALPPFVDSVTVADTAPATLATSLGVNYVTF